MCVALLLLLRMTIAYSDNLSTTMQYTGILMCAALWCVAGRAPPNACGNDLFTVRTCAQFLWSK